MQKRKIEIVLIEDNQHEADLIRHSLKKYDMVDNFVHIDNGPSALEYILDKKNSPDDAGYLPKIIFLDLKLPRMNGFEILYTLKSNENSRYIPVIILTSSSEEKDISKGYSLGANSYVVKPVEFDIFAKTIVQMGIYWTELNKLKT